MMRTVWAGLLLLSAPACDRIQPSEDVVTRAAFGIFYGGQVQEREQIPFEVDRARQVQGIRVEFRQPLRREVKIAWEVNRPKHARPSAEARRRGSGDRIVELGEATAKLGQTRFEQLLPFQPGDPLGTWNVRVIVDGRLALDRRFLVYDAQERARAEREDGGRP
jgi:hypothetical protein